jgi:hypothetical protein
VQSTICELASISEEEVVPKFFKIRIEKPLKVIQEARKPENSRNSISRQIDHASNESSPSLLRYSFFFSFSYYMLLHVVRVAQSVRDHVS